MVRREWTRIALAAAVGVIIFAAAFVYNGAYQYYSAFDIAGAVLFSPVYGVGLIYGIKTVFKLAGSFIKWIGGMWFYRGIPKGCGVEGCMSIFFEIFAVAFLFGGILMIGWIAGLIYAGKLLKEAENMDYQLNV